MGSNPIARSTPLLRGYEATNDYTVEYVFFRISTPLEAAFNKAAQWAEERGEELLFASWDGETVVWSQTTDTVLLRLNPEGRETFRHPDLGRSVFTITREELELTQGSENLLKQVQARMQEGFVRRLEFLMLNDIAENP